MTTHQRYIDAPQSFPSRSFPRPETPLARMIGDKDYREAFHRRLQASNKFVVFFYRIGLLPLLGAGRNTMLLITTGRKSLRPRYFPVGYFRLRGDIYQISGWGSSSNWYKNIKAHPQNLKLQVGFRKFVAEAQFIQEPAEVRRVVEQLVMEAPVEAKRLLGWDSAIDSLDSADFSPILENLIFVRYVPRG